MEYHILQINVSVEVCTAEMNECLGKPMLRIVSDPYAMFHIE